MSSVNSAYSTSSRITGVYSNLDTDALVEKMTATQQSKIDKQEQKKTRYEWYNEALNDVLDSVKEFSSTYCSVLGKSSMLKSSSYVKYSVSSIGTSSGAAVLSASGSADEGTVSVKVNQLAANASVSSSGKISKDGTSISSSNTAALSQLSFANELQFDDEGEICFSINGKTFTFNRSTTLQSMINTINSDSDAGVTMKYSRLTDGFTITADSGGKNSKVTIENITGNAFGTGGAFQISAGTVENGQNSIAEINGVAVEKDSNEYTIDNITYQLNSVSDNAERYNISKDYSAATDSISNFVTALNQLIEKLNGYLTADDNSYDYPPLTEAQKEEMSDEEIEKWEAKAKSGILKNNSIVKDLLAGIKSAFYTSAGGTSASAASIGITTGSYYSSDKGQLVIDTEALESALAESPDKVISIFTGGSSSAESSAQGVIYKIINSISAFKSSANSSKTSTEDKIDSVEDTIDKLEEKLDAMAEKYYNKFSAMETALAKLNSQASYLSQLFSY